MSWRRKRRTSSAGQNQLKDYANARLQFREQLAAFPQGPLAADAKFMQAECLFKQENYQAAWSAYQTALESPASTPMIDR